MATLLPIDPADFPDVPTRKALIALDLQNDFLAADGALPVKQPDGMVERIIALAAAVRASGHGEVIWVRSQFDTSRPAGEQQLVSAETPQLSTRPGASRSGPSTAASDGVESDAEAFLSEVEDSLEQAGPTCVRKGTKGADLLPAIATAKGPKDYAMTKSYYSAFESGQLLNLLRRQFATELIICGSLSNVSVYATALAASSHGLDITIVEDCCGYRSEMRHMNAARILTEQTGCEFMHAADIIPTLAPRSPPTSAAARPAGRPPQPPTAPPHIPPELIAVAMAGSRGKGISVRPRPSPPPLITDPNHGASKGEMKAKDKVAAEPKSARPAELPLSPDLLVYMEKLKLSTDLPEPALTTSTSREAVTATLLGEDDSPQTWEHIVAWGFRV